MPRPINEDKLVAKMTKAFIIPNWYKPEHFGQSEDWDKAKVERFKQYFAKSLSAYDPFYAMVSEYMKEFEEYEDEQIEKESEEDNDELPPEPDDDECEQCGSTTNVCKYWWIEWKRETWNLCEECGIKEEQTKVEDDDDEEISDSTIITGVVCTKCNATLPPHTCEQHLDINNPIHKCPHIQCDCCDNVATESFDGVPCCKTCYDNGIEYYRSMEDDI